MANDGDPASGGVSGETMSLGNRMLSIYATPGEVFDQVRSSPPCAGNWLLPTLVLLLAMAAAVWIRFAKPAVILQIREQSARQVQKMVQAGKLTADQADAADERTQRLLTPNFLRITGILAGGVFTVAGLFLYALVLWLLGTRLFSAAIEYGKTLEITALAGMIQVLNVLVTSLLVAAKGNGMVTPGPAFFVEELDLHNPLHTVLTGLNVLTLWHVAVLALGLARLGRIAWWKTAACLYSIWFGVSALFFGLGRLFS
jgi:hypothetical protein